MIKMQIIGNIGQNARVTDVNGRRSINFSVAHNKKYKDSEGVEVETTLWVNCSYWKNADQSTEIAKYLIPGTKVFVEGIPDVKLYKNKDGQQSVSMNCMVTQIELLSAKKESDTERTEEREPVIREMIRPNQSSAPAGPDGDDLPF
ncbi:MAG: single-stranded DNA-binding protein [Bacteroidetes bacterium]|nr:single-stranded DNA-binding protein [Bacteroidota bacterium]